MEEKNFIRMTDDGAKCIAVLGQISSTLCWLQGGSEL